MRRDDDEQERTTVPESRRFENIGFERGSQEIALPMRTYASTRTGRCGNRYAGLGKG